VYCEGEFDGQWIRTDAIDGKILTVDVIYSGETLHRVVIAGSPITLAQAIRLHSLQPGFADPILGMAKDRDGNTYGIVDVANDIVYHCSGTSAMSTVKTVTYLSLLQIARTAKPYASSTSPIQSSVTDDHSAQKARNRQDAAEGVSERTDKVIGSGKMVLALIGQVSTWYEVDKSHPEAAEKSGDLRVMNLRFNTYWRELMLYADENKSLLQEQDLAIIPFDMKKEIESKMRQLNAMGFEE
jgi:hypothetical protein